jgi:hypothetical protein
MGHAVARSPVLKTKVNQRQPGASHRANPGETPQPDLERFRKVMGEVTPIHRYIGQPRADQRKEENEDASIDPFPHLPLWSAARDSP